MKPHKHAEIIKAWADGAEVQMLDRDGVWVDAHKNWPWFDDWTYRIKLEPKPDLKLFYFASDNGVQCSSKIHIHNLVLTFDGATGALKSAEVV